MKRFIILLFLFVQTLLFSFGQTNYYVSATGNNGSAGTLAAPWRTIQFGLSRLSSNDTLNVLGGIYNEKIAIPVSNIYLRNYLSDTPIIHATGITSQDAIISISNKSNVTISGFELRNNIQNDAQGILIEGAGANITINNCKIHDIHFSSNAAAPVNANKNAQGIIVYGTNAVTALSNIKIINNQLYDCRLGFSEGIAMNGNVNGFEVSGNLVYNLTNIGIDAIGHEGTCSNPANDQAQNGLIKNNTIHHCLSTYATSGGIYVDGGKNITVENNIAYRNGYGIEIGCENKGKTTDAINVRNNLFYDNQVCAIALGGYDYPNGSGKVINASVRNNTCYYNGYSNSGNGELYLSYSENSIIENNIFNTNSHNILAYAELSQPALNFNYNAVFCSGGIGNLETDWNGISYTGFNSFVSGSATNLNSVFSNPLFISANLNSPNFHLTGSSPVINKGNPNYTPALTEVDMDKQPRANGRIDCGADEFYVITGTSDNEQKRQYSLYPNPSASDIMLKTSRIFRNADLTIYNAVGKQIKQIRNINGQTYSLKHNQFMKGIYFLNMQEGKESFKTKFIILD